MTEQNGNGKNTVFGRQTREVIGDLPGRGGEGRDFSGGSLPAGSAKEICFEGFSDKRAKSTQEIRNR